MTPAKKTGPARLLLTAVAIGALALLGLAPTLPASGATSHAPVAPPDPADPGPFAVTSTEYDLGDSAYTPPALHHAVEVIGSVHYPSDLSQGPYPLIVLMHGRHVTCYEGSHAYLDWPCTGGTKMIPSYQGYDYLAENLASWGYIVVSVSADGINALDSGTDDGGALSRAQLIQHHLDLWQTWDTKGAKPFGKTFVGKVDLQNVGLMGHSRGGEGVTESYLYNQSLGSPYGIRAVLALAPVDFNRHVDSDVPLSVILPYCDGDVSDNQGIHFYDDSLYEDPNDNAPKNYLEVMGANHNYFNTIWTPGGWPAGTSDDWGGGSDPICGSQSGSERLSAEQQRAVGLDYMAGFFRLYIGGESAFLPYFDGTEIQPTSVAFADLHNAYQAPGSERLTVNNFLKNKDLKTNLLGGKVSRKGLSPFDLCGGAPPEPPTCASTGSAQMPHTVGSVFSGRSGLSQNRFGWTSKKSFTTEVIPTGEADVSAFAAVSFRIAQNITASHPVEKMRIVLTDAKGRSSAVPVSPWSDALFQPQGTTAGYTPKLILNTVRVPLSAFSGIDLTRLKAVTLTFTTHVGSVLMTDLAFND